MAPAALIFTMRELPPSTMNTSCLAVALSVWAHRPRTLTTSVYSIFCMHLVSQLTICGLLNQLMSNTAQPSSSFRPNTLKFDGAV